MIAGFYSAIISHIPGYQDQLMEWISESGFGNRYWTPCYRGTKDGWSNTNFHSNCDNKGPTITLGRKDSFIFGGFSDHNWKG